MSEESEQNDGDRRIRRIGAGLVVLAAVAGGVILALDRDEQSSPTAVVVAVVDRGDVTVDVATIGSVEPATIHSLSFGASGTVASVTVRAGNKVTKGQALAALDNTDATDAVSDARSSLAEAQTRLTSATAVSVRTTASAATCTRPAPPTVTAAAPARGLAAPTRGGGNGAPPAADGGDGMPPLAGRGGGSLRVADGGDGMPPLAGPGVVGAAARSGVPGVVGAAARTAAAGASPCVTRGYPDSGSDPVLAAQQQVNRAARVVEEAATALAGATISAPIAGTVVDVAGSVGDQVRAGATFVSLADTYTMQVVADFPEADAGALAVGQSAEITLADSDAVLGGQVVQVDPAGTSDGTLVRYGVLISFADSPADLLVGQSARVKVRTGAVAGALRVPSTAVHDVSGGAGTVLVRAGDSSAERTVAVGLRGDQYTEITGGLTEGDQVVRSW